MKRSKSAASDSVRVRALWQRQIFFWSHSDSIQVFTCTTKLISSPQVREILYSSESFIAWMTEVGCVREILMNLKLYQVTCNNLKKEDLSLAQSGSDLFLVPVAFKSYFNVWILYLAQSICIAWILRNSYQSSFLQIFPHSRWSEPPDLCSDLAAVTFILKPVNPAWLPLSSSAIAFYLFYLIWLGIQYKVRCTIRLTDLLFCTVFSSCVSYSDSRSNFFWRHSYLF